MSILLVDFGNSRLKWSAYTDSLSLTSASVTYHDKPVARILDGQWAELVPPERVVVASVAEARIKQELQQWLQHHWSLVPEFIVSPAQGQGIRSAYTEPARLGCDRWAAMVAAYQQAGLGICVVDCGTAVTLDVVTVDGQHRGGLILPGLGAMQTGLTQHTKLPKVDFGSATQALLGTRTEDAIVLGATRAIAALIEQSIVNASQQYHEQLACYLTGGDMGRIVPYLTLPYRQVPDLVLQGLAMIAGGN